MRPSRRRRLVAGIGFAAIACGWSPAAADSVRTTVGVARSIAADVAGSVGGRCTVPRVTMLDLGDLAAPGSGFSVTADYTHPAAPTITYTWHGSANYYIDCPIGAKVELQIVDASGFTTPYAQRSPTATRTTDYNAPTANVDLAVVYYSTGFPGARQLSAVTVEGRGYYRDRLTQTWVLTDCKRRTYVVAASPARPLFLLAEGSAC